MGRYHSSFADADSNSNAHPDAHTHTRGIALDHPGARWFAHGITRAHLRLPHRDPANLALTHTFSNSECRYIARHLSQKESAAARVT